MTYDVGNNIFDLALIFAFFKWVFPILALIAGLVILYWQFRKLSTPRGMKQPLLSPQLATLIFIFVAVLAVAAIAGLFS